MATKLEEQLARIKAEIERQDAEWERSRSILASMGEVEILVSHAVLGDVADLASVASRTPLPAGSFIRA
jgi:hypothetical protein